MPFAAIVPGSDSAIGVEVSMPSARARCWVTISFGMTGLHSIANSRSLSIVETFHRQGKQAFVSVLTRTGLRACNSLRPRLTSRCSLLPNMADSAGLDATLIRGTFFSWARSWNTESRQIIPLEIRWIFGT